MSENDPGALSKPNVKEWLEQFLPFALPSIPFVQTALNVDKAVARLIAAGGRNLEARVDASSARVSARSAAQVRFIEGGAQAAVKQTSGEGSLTERAIDYALGEAAEKQRNRENIARLAMEDLRLNPPEQDAAGEIDPDWLSSYADLSATKSNADVQELWARILSGEIRKPGSFSLRTLETLATYDQEDAQKLVELFQYVFNGEFVFTWEEGGSVPYGLLAAGEEARVLRSVAFPMQKSRSLPANVDGAFNAQDRWIRITCEQDVTVKYYAYPLTRQGRELAALVGPQKMPEPYLMAFASVLKNGGFKVQIARRGPEFPDGSFLLVDVIDV